MSIQSDKNDQEMWEAYNPFHYLCDTHRFQKLVSRIEMVRMIGDLPGDIVDVALLQGS